MRKPTKAAVAAIAAIEKRNNGTVRPDDVVEAAMDPASPLHGYFEWCQEKAAHAHRLDQARELIRSIKVLVVTKTRTIAAVGYVRRPDLPPDEQGYTSIARIRTDADLARAALIEEFSRASSALARAHRLAAAFSLEGEVKSLEQQCGRLARQIEEQTLHA